MAVEPVGAITTMKTIRPLGVWVLGLALAGCSPYVNIPGEPGSVATASTNDLGVREAIAESLKLVIRQDPPAADWAIVLPEGTSDRNYAYVIEEVGGGKRLADAAGDAPVYDVVSIRIRGLDGYVDLVPPVELTRGVARVQTVYLKHKLDQWHAQWSRLWHIPVADAMAIANPDAAPRFVNYLPVRERPAEEPAETETAE